MKFLILFILFFSVGASANEFLGGVGTNLNYQLSTNGRTYEAVAPWSLRAGYRFRFADVYGEYSYAHSSSGTDMVSIAQSNQEFLLWVRKGDPTARRVKPYVALGLGLHSQSVSTRFGSLNETVPGVYEILGAAAGGVEWRIVRLLSLSVEARVTTAETYTPNPLFGLGTYLSIIF